MAVPRHLKVETCISPTDAIRALRQLVVEANWSARRISGSRLIDRWAVIVPIAQAARTIGIVIENGPLKDVGMEAYSHVQGAAGSLTIVEWLIPNELEKEWRTLFAQWAARLPKCPWKWTFGERSTIGFLLPVWRRSKRTFKNQGVNVDKSAWPDTNLPSWPPSEWILSAEEE
jgi:hypothetical protein